MVITCGLPATCKTGLAGIAVKSKGYHLLRSDILRLEIFCREDVFKEEIASSMDKRAMVYDEMFRRADNLLDNPDSGVLLDATFITQALRRQAAEIAARHRRTFVILETKCKEDIAIGRVLKRTKDNYESNALTEQAYRNNKQAWEAVDTAAIGQACPGLRIIHALVETSLDFPQNWYVTMADKPK